jgi:hypothetical protein
MKFKDIKELLGNKYSTEEIKKAINKISPSSFKKQMNKDDKDSNAIIELIRKKIKSV